jgi:hypothetical protein
LHGADPGDCRRRLLESVDVVGLEDAEAVDEAPGIHYCQVAHYGWRNEVSIKTY